MALSMLGEGFDSPIDRKKKTSKRGAVNQQTPLPNGSLPNGWEVGFMYKPCLFYLGG